jgi:hypothetical protein
MRVSFVETLKWTLWRTTFGALIAVCLVACQPTACRPVPQVSGDQRPWEKGAPVTAPELETLLQPTEPTKWTALRKGTDGSYYYLAELQNAPSGDFIERQHEAYRSRGVFTRAIGESPHSFPRTLGYEHLMFRKGRSRPWSLHSLEIKDYNVESMSDAPFYRQYPKPIHVEGRLLVFRLGQSDVTAWKERVIVPEQDVMALKELPFPRFPGALVNYVGGDRESPVVTRYYVVRTRGINEVLEYYREAITHAGFPIDYDRNRPRELTWRVDGQAVKDVIRIRVVEFPLPLLPGNPLSLAQVRERAPSLFTDFPHPLGGYQVSVVFENTALAVPYQPEEDSSRASR